MTIRMIQGNDLGPIYGPIDDFCLPILGLPYFPVGYLDTLSTVPNSHTAQPMTIYADGFGSLTALSLVEGDFEASGHTFTEPKPTLWCAKDCITIAKLVYNQAGFHFPDTVFRVDETDFRQVSDFHSSVPWLAQTDFGRTQFCVLYWLQILARFPHKIHIANPEIATAEHVRMARELLAGLERLRRQKAFKHTDRFFMRLIEFQTELQGVGKDAQGDDEGTLLFHRFGFSFEVWRAENLTDKRSLDAEFSAAYTELFNAYIYDLLPVFGRYAILNMLFFGMHQFKNSGLNPSDRFMHFINTPL